MRKLNLALLRFCFSAPPFFWRLGSHIATALILKSGTPFALVLLAFAQVSSFPLSLFPSSGPWHV
jgi:hypothetical protein